MCVSVYDGGLRNKTDGFEFNIIIVVYVKYMHHAHPSRIMISHALYIVIFISFRTHTWLVSKKHNNENIRTHVSLKI